MKCRIPKRHPIPHYGVSFVNICEKIDRDITAPHCIGFLWHLNLNLNLNVSTWAPCGKCDGDGLCLLNQYFSLEFSTLGLKSAVAVDDFCNENENARSVA